MKVHGTYYKRDKKGLGKKEFTLDVNNNPLPSMRKEATAKLQASDPDFAGLRELFVEKQLETLGTFGDSERKPLIVIIDGCKYSLDATDEPNVFTVGDRISETTGSSEFGEAEKFLEDTVRQKAKDLKIKNWHNRKIDGLIEEIRKHEEKK
jgi:hypothetical protein